MNYIKLWTRIHLNNRIYNRSFHCVYILHSRVWSLQWYSHYSPARFDRCINTAQLITRQKLAFLLLAGSLSFHVPECEAFPTGRFTAPVWIVVVFNRGPSEREGPLRSRAIFSNRCLSESVRDSTFVC